MNFFLQIGIGLLTNAVFGGGQSTMAQFQSLQSQQTQQLQQLRTQVDEHGFDVADELNTPQQLKVDKAPAFPETSLNGLQTMQTDHFQQRLQATNDLNNRLDALKNQFFTDNHYNTTTDAQGKTSLALNDQGRPVISSGPENSQQQQARLEWETANMSNRTSQQAVTRDQFQTAERQQIQTFLQTNSTQLGNPAVQAQLQGMVVDSQHRQLGLYREQDLAQRTINLPTDEMSAAAEQGTQKIWAMEDQQGQEEESSPEAQTLRQYQQDLGNSLASYKDQARQQAQDEQSLKRPTFAGNVNIAGAQNQDYATALPAHLSASLFSMGIYSIN